MAHPEWLTAISFNSHTLQVSAARRDGIYGEYMIVINEDYLRRILREYFDYHQDSRPHRSSERNLPVSLGLAKQTKIANAVEASLPADVLGMCVRLPSGNPRFRRIQKAKRRKLGCKPFRYLQTKNWCSEFGGCW